MRRLTAILLAFSLLVHGSPALAGEPDPVVVELFTSQACPACPAAEAYLRELARRSDVIALEYHIDYYDYSGWKDPFGQPDFTMRWRGYAKSLGARYEYTPFMVIGGAAHLVGSEREKVERQIQRQQLLPAPQPRLNISLANKLATVTVDGDRQAGLLDVILACYDGRHETMVTTGENRGKTLVNVNVVRDFRRIAQWVGDPVTVRIPLSGLKGSGGCALLLQQAGGGPILAARAVKF